MATSERPSRINVPLSSDVKKSVERAAAQLGQTVTEFAATVLGQAAHQVIREAHLTALSARDSKVFIELIDDPSIKPNKALRAAAKRYKQRMG